MCQTRDDRALRRAIDRACLAYVVWPEGQRQDALTLPLLLQRSKRFACRGGGCMQACSERGTAVLPLLEPFELFYCPFPEFFKILFKIRPPPEICVFQNFDQNLMALKKSAYTTHNLHTTDRTSRISHLASRISHLASNIRSHPLLSAPRHTSPHPTRRPL